MNEELINTIFYYANTMDEYRQALQQNKILSRTIVFVDETQEIYKDGKLFGGLRLQKAASRYVHLVGESVFMRAHVQIPERQPGMVENLPSVAGRLLPKIDVSSTYTLSNRSFPREADHGVLGVCRSRVAVVVPLPRAVDPWSAGEFYQRACCTIFLRHGLLEVKVA